MKIKSLLFVDVTPTHLQSSRLCLHSSLSCECGFIGVSFFTRES